MPRASKPPEQLMFGGMRNMQHRQFWPHGYTPERLAEVRAAMPATSSFAGADYKHERDQVTKAVARSSVPPEHLKGIGTIATGMTDTKGSPMLRGYDPAQHTGYYNRDTQIGPLVVTRASYTEPIKVDGGRGARQLARNQRDHTLIHEVGHHVDYANNAGRTLSKGAREAVAENYALTHQSKRGRPSTAGYDEARWEEGVFNDHDFFDYTRGREHGIMPANMAPATAAVRMRSTVWPRYHQTGLDIAGR